MSTVLPSPARRRSRVARYPFRSELAVPYVSDAERLVSSAECMWRTRTTQGHDFQVLSGKSSIRAGEQRKPNGEEGMFEKHGERRK
jgi:hypothetical protein